MRKAYELNPYDLSMAAAYGYGLIFSGNYRDRNADPRPRVEVSSAHPTWWDYGLFVGQFMLGDMNKAALATEALATTQRRIALSGGAADRGQGRRPRHWQPQLLDELISEFPKFAADPATVFRTPTIPPI